MPLSSQSIIILLIGLLWNAVLLSCLHREKKIHKARSTADSDRVSSSLCHDPCFQSSDQAIALLDENGLILLGNPLFEQAFPLPDSGTHPTPLDHCLPPEMATVIEKNLAMLQLARGEDKLEFSHEKQHFCLHRAPQGCDHDAPAKTYLFCRGLPPKKAQLGCLSPNDVIWKTILKLTNPSALHSDWQNCFTKVLPDLQEALDADELFLLDNSAPQGTPRSLHATDRENTRNHEWILTVPSWMNTLAQGKEIQDSTDNFGPEEQAILEQEGISTLLLIPLIVAGKLLGLIGLTKTREEQLFPQEQVNNLLLIANILTMAIGNRQDRAERDRLVTVVEQSSDCIIIINPRGSILYANPACEKVTGFSPQEIVGDSIKRLYSPSIQKRLWDQLKEALSTGEEWSGQFKNYRKDQTPYQEEMLVSPVYDQEGLVANQVIVKRDITEDKRLESIAEAANLMENIGFIFSSIRHELGNPINSIKVSLSVLESNLETYDTEAIGRFIRRSLSDIGRVEYLLKTLRNFSVFERPDIQATDMVILLDKLLQLTEKDLAKHQVTLSVEHPAPPLIGMIDPRAFLQVLLNLITNAVAAMTETKVKEITISLIHKQKDQISFIFADNGSGMEEDTVKNLFRPFFTTKAEGTGLGLVIVKKMLSKMNCSITASSQKGQGTRMEIIIPTA